MDDYLSKPVKSEDLLAMLQKWVSSNKPSQPFSSAPAEPVPAVVELGPVLDVEFIETLKQLGGEEEPDFLPNLVKQFITDGAGHVDTIRGAIASGDAGVLERTAHTLKSGCNAVGALRMAELCQELQALGRAGSVDGAGVSVERLGGEFDRVRQALDLEVSKIRGTEVPQDRDQRGLEDPAV